MMKKEVRVAIEYKKSGSPCCEKCADKPED
jgi:hypothetical protein